jgi:DNA-binding transcriptional LysR family regulator
MTMELRHLEHFVAVAEERSFTRAAARLHVVQSGLSVSIRSLERELQARLFDRTTHRVGLTDAGLALLVEARRTLEAADGARDAVAAVRGGVRGRLRIGIMQSLALVDLAGLLTRFHQERPQVQIIPRPASGGSSELARDVVEGQLDVAFTAVPGGYPPGLSVLPLASERMMLACAPEHPLAQRDTVGLHEIDGERFVDFPAGWGTRMAADRLLAAEGIRREVAVEVADVATVIELIRAGLGLGFLSPSLVPEAGRIVLREVSPSPVFEVSLIAPNEHQQTAAARAFLQLASEDSRDTVNPRTRP